MEAEAVAERGLRKLYEKQQQLELLETIAAASNQSTSIEATFGLAIKEICKFTEWPLGQAYIVHRRGEDLRLDPLHVRHAADADALRPLMEATKAISFASGEGLPGRVFASATPAWLQHLATDRNFPRAGAVAACGINSGMAFPILVGRDVAAVVEFFSYKEQELDTALLTLLGQIGLQLGRVIERKQAQDRLIHDASHDGLTGLPCCFVIAWTARSLVQSAFPANVSPFFSSISTVSSWSTTVWVTQRATTCWSRSRSV
jgi:GAF domain-containing protein